MASYIDNIDSRKRYEVLGNTKQGRLLCEIWTEQNGYEGQRQFNSMHELLGVAKEKYGNG